MYQHRNVSARTSSPEGKNHPRGAKLPILRLVSHLLPPCCMHLAPNTWPPVQGPSEAFGGVWVWVPLAVWQSGSSFIRRALL